MIKLEEVEWIPSSTGDSVGRVFQWNGRIYRAIRHDATSFLKELFEKGIVDKLIAKGLLIESEIVPYSLEGFGMVICHRSIPFPSYPFEWSSKMFQDAAILICDLSLELDSFGLELKDAHPWNIMFDGYQPKFIDIGSIALSKNKRGWGAFNEFLFRFMFPLYCMGEGKGNDVRHLMRYEFDDTVFQLRVLNLLSLYRRITKTLYELRHLTLSPRNKLIRTLHKEILSMNFKLSKTEWSSYADGDNEYFLSFQLSDSWPEKQRNVYDMLLKLQPKSVVDIGCNVGWYSELAARQGSHVLSIDLDETSLINLYARVKSQCLPIQTVLADFVTGTASNITWPAASERYRGQMVLALALIHHLVFKRNLHFDLIAKELSKYTEQWLLVEFVPPNDPYIKNWNTERFDWYTLDNFISSLRRFFNKVEVLESAPKPRKLVFCEKQ